MDDETKIDALKFLAETHRTESLKRRELEIKFFGMALAIYVFIVVGVYTGQASLRPLLTEWFILPVFLLPAIAASIYLAQIHKANNKNKAFAESAETSLRELIKEPVVVEAATSTPPWMNPFWFMQTAILFAFAAAAWFLISAKR